MKRPIRLKLWRLKDEKIKEKVKDMIKETAKETECWEEWNENIMKVANKVCGTSNGVHKLKATWW